ncbi:MAG: hypothetical protein FVQ80_18540, partial [Planctomycetes bacterium]|nr:hypothetical protein [Planctomycetota bacterium]
MAYRQSSEYIKLHTHPFQKLAGLGILASSVAHEINNPLGGLFNCVHNLERQGADANFRKRYLDLIKEGL